MSKPNMAIDPDKARPIVEFLNRPENRGMPHTEAARILGVNESYVRRARASHTTGVAMKLNVRDIVADPDIQLRADKPGDATIEEYAEAYRLKMPMPDLVVFREGGVFRVADGFTRLAGAIAAGAKKVDCEVREGGKREAILFAAGANASHGIRRSNADKRNAVLTLLNDEEWSKWSDGKIAKQCEVDDKTVARYRPESRFSLRNSGVTSVKTIDKHGRETTMNTTNIGPKPAAEVDEEGSFGPDDDDATWGVTGDLTVVGSNGHHAKNPQENGAVAVAAIPAKVGQTTPDFVADAPPAIVPPTDDEWLATLPLLAKLSGRPLEIYRADALAYRHLTESPAYAEFKRLAKGEVRSRRHDPVKGIYLHRTDAWLDLKHPRNWLLCSPCGGKGCESCKRRGYALS